MFSQKLPTTPCKSSITSVWQFLLKLGLLSDEKIERMVTLPEASITASSDPVGLQDRCFSGPPSGEAKLGVTVVIVTHELSVVQALCRHVAVLADGVLVEQFPVAEAAARGRTALARELAQLQRQSSEPARELAYA